MARTYVITGAASGIGAATSALLKARGAKVIGIDLLGCDIEADLANSAGRKQAAESAIEMSNGSIDAVIPCAGLMRANLATVSVNFFGVTEFLIQLLPVLQKSASPRVALPSSVASLFPNSAELVEAMLGGDESVALEVAQGLIDGGRESAGLIYGSTKRAIARWVRRESIKPEWAGAGIPINGIGPGIVETPMVDRLLATDESRAATDALIPMPLNHHLKAEQVAYLLAWLTSEENSHVTGQTIYIDGGSDVTIRGENIWA